MIKNFEMSMKFFVEFTKKEVFREGIDIKTQMGDVLLTHVVTTRVSYNKY